MTSDNKTAFLQGCRDGVPIALGYFAVAFSIGIIARHAGLAAWQGFTGSALTRASAGEYGVYTLVAAHAALVEVVAMSIVTNLRYLLMTAALSQKFADSLPLWQRFCVALCVTDEIFGISIAWPGKLAPAYTYGAAAVSTPMWALGTATGIIAGGALPPSVVSALSVALYGMFIAIIIPPAREHRAIGLTVLAGFALSWLCDIAPLVSQASAGARTIALTIIIAAIAAALKPVSD